MFKAITQAIHKKSTGTELLRSKVFLHLWHSVCINYSLNWIKTSKSPLDRLHPPMENTASLL